MWKNQETLHTSVLYLCTNLVKGKYVEFDSHIIKQSAKFPKKCL
jgi:hypothetical protein